MVRRRLVLPVSVVAVVAVATESWDTVDTVDTVEVVEDLLKENVEKGGQFLIGGDGTGRLEGVIRRRVRDLDCKETPLLEKVDDKVPVLAHEIEADHFL